MSVHASKIYASYIRRLFSSHLSSSFVLRVPLQYSRLKLQAFPRSVMGRDLATIRATFNGKPILIMTSHLESEKQSSNERKAQFNQVRLLVGRAPGALEVEMNSWFTCVVSSLAAQPGQRKPLSALW